MPSKGLHHNNNTACSSTRIHRVLSKYEQAIKISHEAGMGGGAGLYLCTVAKTNILGENQPSLLSPAGGLYLPRRPIQRQQQQEQQEQQHSFDETEEIQSPSLDSSFSFLASPSTHTADSSMIGTSTVATESTTTSVSSGEISGGRHSVCSSSNSSSSSKKHVGNSDNSDMNAKFGFDGVSKTDNASLFSGRGKTTTSNQQGYSDDFIIRFDSDSFFPDFVSDSTHRKFDGKQSQDNNNDKNILDDRERRSAPQRRKTSILPVSHTNTPKQHVHVSRSKSFNLDDHRGLTSDPSKELISTYLSNENEQQRRGRRRAEIVSSLSSNHERLSVTGHGSIDNSTTSQSTTSYSKNQEERRGDNRDGSRNEKKTRKKKVSSRVNSDCDHNVKSSRNREERKQQRRIDRSPSLEPFRNGSVHKYVNDMDDISVATEWRRIQQDERFEDVTAPQSMKNKDSKVAATTTVRTKKISRKKVEGVVKRTTSQTKDISRDEHGSRQKHQQQENHEHLEQLQPKTPKNVSRGMRRNESIPPPTVTPTTTATHRRASVDMIINTKQKTTPKRISTNQVGGNSYHLPNDRGSGSRTINDKVNFHVVEDDNRRRPNRCQLVSALNPDLNGSSVLSFDFD